MASFPSLILVNILEDMLAVQIDKFVARPIHGPSYNVFVECAMASKSAPYIGQIP